MPPNPCFETTYMAGFVASFHATPGFNQSEDKESDPAKPTKTNSEKETRSRGGSFRLGKMFGGLNFFGPPKSPSPKQSRKKPAQARPEQQPPAVINKQPTADGSHRRLEQSYNLPEDSTSDMVHKHQDLHKDWVEVDDSECGPTAKIVPDSATMDHVTPSEKREMEDKLSKANQEILVLRDQVRQVGNELEERKALIKSHPGKKESEGDDHSESETDRMKQRICELEGQLAKLKVHSKDQSQESEGDDHSESKTDHLKQRVHELEDQLAKLKEHSKDQSRTVFQLKEEALGAEMQEDTIKSYEGMIEDLEERQQNLQKRLGKVLSELETVTKYKEAINRELALSKEEAFRAAAENEELRAQLQKMSEPIEAANDLKRENYKLENENIMLKTQLETFQVQISAFQKDFGDERRDREAAHSKLADLEKELAREKGCHTEEKAEYHRQLAIAQQEVDDLRKEFEQTHKELENHKATLASVEALNEKLKKKKAKEDTDSFWHKEAEKLKKQLQEAEQHVTQLMSSHDDLPAKETQVKELMKKLEKKNYEIDKLNKKVTKLEEEANKSKKKQKKKDSGATAPEVPPPQVSPPQDSVDAQKLARAEQLYNDASEENQELHSELANWQGRYQQLQNQNLELQRQVDAMKVNLKEQDKQLKKTIIATTPDDPSQMNLQLQMGDTQTGQLPTGVPVAAVRNNPNLPLRATATSVFDADVVCDSASPRQPSKVPLRAVAPDNVHPPTPPGLTNEPFPSQSTPLPHVSASTVPAATNYHQGQGLTVADQMQRFGSVTQPCGQINPGTVLPPQVRTAPPGPVDPHGMNVYVNIDQYQQQQGFQPQPGYAGGPSQQMVSDSQYPPQQGLNEQEFETLYQKQMLEREQHKQYQLQKEQEYQLQQQAMQARQQRVTQLRQQQAQVEGQAQGYQQQFVHGQMPTAYENTGIPQQNFPPSQAPFNQALPNQQYYHQDGAPHPNNLQYEHNPAHVVDTDGFNSAGTPSEIPEGGNVVCAEESSNGSDQATSSLVGVKKPSVGAGPRPHSDDVLSNKLQGEAAQPKPKSNPVPSSSNKETFQEIPPQEIFTPLEEAPPDQTNLSVPPDVDPNESLGDQRYGNVLQDSIDNDISQRAADVIEQVSSGRERQVTNTARPFDPNLVCPICNRAFRIGEIQKFRAHVNQCEGKKN